MENEARVRAFETVARHDGCISYGGICSDEGIDHERAVRVPNQDDGCWRCRKRSVISRTNSGNELGQDGGVNVELSFEA